MIEKILLHIRRGFGLVQLIDELELSQAAVLELMEKDSSFKNKMLKRFSDEWLRGEEKTPAVPTKTEESKSAFVGLSLGELKKRADIVGLIYNANIKEKTLTEKLDNYLKTNPEKKVLLDPKKPAVDDIEGKWEAIEERAKAVGYTLGAGDAYEKCLVEVEKLEAEAKAKTPEGSNEQ